MVFCFLLSILPPTLIAIVLSKKLAFVIIFTMFIFVVLSSTAMIPLKDCILTELTCWVLC
ncbi:hypothetical protein BJ165DRAFT_1516859 [Panaeolus papilionaceus]|nr:hypothetical protein BJ165DRAFT_1516859 [Panaeolus papilionaceus]